MDQKKKTNPALLPETDARVLIARLRARSLAEGETEGNSLYRDSANALEVAAGIVCSCGKPIEHIDADEDSYDWACLVRKEVGA